MLLGLLATLAAVSLDTLPDTTLSRVAPVDLAPTQEHLSLLRRDYSLTPDPPEQGRPKAYHYSDGYYTRLKIHKYASYLTLPLFAAQVWSGSKLWNEGEDAGFARDIHGPVAASIAGLFAVNTVTGVWNLWEGRKDPNGRTRRIVHSLLMITADAGFVATGASAPDDDEGEGGSGATRHRNLALGSMGVALSSYLMMLLWKD